MTSIMKHKRLGIMGALVLFATFAAVTPSFADPMVVTGDQLRFIGQVAGSHTQGGVFLFRNITQGFDFFTFCLEKNELIETNGIYYAQVNTAAINGGVGGGNPDPLDSMTAWLFDQWIRGSLANYNYAGGVGDNASQTALQETIWFIEQETTVLPGGLATTFYNQAVAATPSGLYDVSVLNLWTTFSNGEFSGAKQDILFSPVPEPSSILLLGLGLTGLGIVMRRKARGR